MRAIRFERFGGPEELQLVDVPVPEPGPGEVRVDLHAASVLPVDCKVRAGLLRDLLTVPLPKIPGRDGAGVVGKVGPGVDYLRVGDRVCVVAQHAEAGTYAQHIVRNRESVVPAPPDLDFDSAAALMHAGICAWICLVETAGIRGGMRILVHGGAGAIGALAIQLARHHGAHVVTTCGARNSDYVRQMGAHEVAAYDEEDFTAIADPFDIVLDLIGGSVHHRSYRVLRKGGMMVCLNAAPYTDLSTEYGVSVRLPRIHDRREALLAVTELATRNILRPQVAMRLGLEDAAEAHRLMESGKISRGRIVLHI